MAFMACNPQLTAKIDLQDLNSNCMSWVFDAGKIGLTALIIFAIVQVSERSTLLAAVLASVPIAMMWMNHEGQSAEQISVFAKEIVWLLIPSLLMFIVMPLLIDRGWDFYPALGAGLVTTIVGYFIMIQIMDKFGVIS